MKKHYVRREKTAAVAVLLTAFVSIKVSFATDSGGTVIVGSYSNSPVTLCGTIQEEYQRERSAAQ